MSQTIHERFLALFDRMEATGIRDAPLKRFNMSLPQIGLLATIARQPGSHAQALATALGVTPPTVSVGLRKLEEEGWVRREPDPQDGRAMCHFLTEKAQQAVRMVKRHRRQRVARFLEALSEGEQDQLLGLLEKALKHLDNKSQP
jgi:DNA-binding MarR family transcriptional regulator